MFYSDEGNTFLTQFTYGSEDLVCVGVYLFILELSLFIYLFIVNICIAAIIYLSICLFVCFCTKLTL